MNVRECMNKIKEAVVSAQLGETITAYNWNEYFKNKNVVAFGLGKFFEDTHERLFKKVDVAMLCDNNPEKWGNTYYGKKCVSPDELYQMKNVVVIMVLGDCRSVERQMVEHNIECISITEIHFSAYEKGIDCRWLVDSLGNIEKALNSLYDDKSREIFTNVFLNKIYMSKSKQRYSSFRCGGEYFNNGLWNVTENEYLLDGGAYIGDTIDDFVQITHGKFGAVYSFEYDNNNFIDLKNHIEKNNYENIEIYPYGIWNVESEGMCEHFGDADGTQIVNVDDGNAQKCYLKPLDDVLASKKVTILKLDIEGAEMKGLEGAKNIIALQKPKLAICLYHRPEDLWEIPIEIKKICPEYNMIIRHHGYNYTDSVLYACV